jgi:hypothetical protein
MEKNQAIYVLNINPNESQFMPSPQCKLYKMNEKFIKKALDPKNKHTLSF